MRTLARNELILILSTNLVEGFFLNEDFLPFASRLEPNIILKISSKRQKAIYCSSLSRFSKTDQVLV